MSDYVDGQQLRGDRLAGVPVALGGPGVKTLFDFGSLTAANGGRYKVFSTPFANRPVVMLESIRTAGSHSAILVGTPNVGSFRAKVNYGGSTPIQYFAMALR